MSLHLRNKPLGSFVVPLEAKVLPTQCKEHAVLKIKRHNWRGTGSELYSTNGSQ